MRDLYAWDDQERALPYLMGEGRDELMLVATRLKRPGRAGGRPSCSSISRKLIVDQPREVIARLQQAVADCLVAPGMRMPR